MSDAAWMEQIKYDEQGLVPAIVQDAASKEVLMLAYMNRESLAKTLETRQTWFWSRSRGELWNKGATSGHTQEVVSLKYDCDGDTLLVAVKQNGPACHTGAYSCFYRGETGENAGQAPQDRFAPLANLETTIAQRDAERPEGSYTTYLFEKGLDKILKKIGEETAEVIIAGKNRDAKELQAEAADLIFHLMVLLREQRIPLDNVMDELEFRHRKPVKKD
ncbi:bifunctional phosphoribosyl-AMP cyclohydrolase/phosphoribosyl-ATP diphosphatase HisIE [Cohnella caldifontis]|uniref:bifunctional phosphoribosyl-AMP cyclohydrolase/phosphoribosyl-ATP diphosphatase HisIE n=1 Tax=Cohnella caldifontis TaxID=3027471 RepID=UPI0023EDAE2D|nr:bifunctional phosphoribosyl-AMP cyclohydrolase/phosphoribosyl-ATP diphosphatase HisIE [Cohnella sp. YIM B05605]